MIFCSNTQNKKSLKKIFFLSIKFLIITNILFKLKFKYYKTIKISQNYVVWKFYIKIN